MVFLKNALTNSAGKLYNKTMNRADLKFIIRHVHAKKSVEPTHTHSSHEIVYYVRGEGESAVGKHSYPYKAGTYVYIPAGVKHSEVHKTETEVLFFAFEVQGDFLHIREGIYEDKSKTVLALMQKIAEEIKEKRVLYRESCGFYIGQILVEACRYDNNSPDRNVLEECMEFARDYIRMNIQHRINVRDLAASVGYSYDYFRHRFQEYFGIGAKEFILTERIAAIKIALATGDEPIGEIAKRYAFDSQSHLSVAFKNSEGCTPAEYRRKSRLGSNEIKVKYD